MLSVVESEIAIAFSKKATNVNIHNDLHNGRNVRNSLQNRSQHLSVWRLEYKHCYSNQRFPAVPSEQRIYKASH